MSRLNASKLITFFIFFISCNTDDLKIKQQQKVIKELQDSLSNAKQKEDNLKYYQQSTKYVFSRIDYSYSEYKYQAPTRSETTTTNGISYTTLDSPGRWLETTISKSHYSDILEITNYSNDSGYKLLDNQENEVRENEAHQVYILSLSSSSDRPARNFKITERLPFVFDSYSKASEALFAMKQ